MLLSILCWSSRALADDAAPAPTAPPAAATPITDPPGSAAEPPAPAPQVVWGEVTVKRRAMVRRSEYPPEAIGLPSTKCVVQLHVDAKGVPYAAEPKACPDVFVEAGRAVALRYRFYPVELDGVAKPTEFELAIQFDPPAPR